eukprot:PhF_6_TR25134/c0_g1_i3/m.34594
MSNVNLNEEYTRSCQSHNVKTNSNFSRFLQNHSVAEITTIDLALNFVGKNGLIPVIETAKKCTSLTTLVLRDNFITNETLANVLDILTGHPALSSLDVR